MNSFIEDLKEHCQKNPEVRVNSEKLLQFVECYELAQARLAEIEKQEPAYVFDYEYEEGHEDPDLGGDLIFHQLDGKTYPLGTEFYASPVLQWQPMESAPKNKAILLDIGLPWPVFGIFNTLNDEFSYADMQAENFENATDIYFQTDYEKNPVAWMPLPETVKSPSAKAESNDR